MKLILNTLLIVSLLCSCLPLFSQQCTNDSLSLYSGDFNYMQPGFADPNSLPCASSGNYSEIVIPFNTYNQGTRLLTLADSSTVPVAKVYGLKIESVSSLPSGLCWITRPSNQSISGSQMGLLIIKGTTTASAGTYPLTVNVSMDTQGGGSYTYTNIAPWGYQALLGQVILKVMGSDNNCPAIAY